MCSVINHTDKLIICSQVIRARMSCAYWERACKVYSFFKDAVWLIFFYTYVFFLSKTDRKERFLWTHHGSHGDGAWWTPGLDDGMCEVGIQPEWDASPSQGTVHSHTHSHIEMHPIWSTYFFSLTLYINTYLKSGCMCQHHTRSGKNSDWVKRKQGKKNWDSLSLEAKTRTAYTTYTDTGNDPGLQSAFTEITRAEEDSNIQLRDFQNLSCF